MRVAFKSLGCRVNFEETECLHGRFVAEGWTAVPFEAEADVYVINTCTVTGVADAESRKLIRRAVRLKPEDGVVAVTGCYSQRDPETLRALAGVDLVLGNVEKAELFEHVMRVRADRRLAGDIQVHDRPRTERFLPHLPASDNLRTRATLKVQDGCDEACTYCIIPAVRGPSVSRDLDEITRETHRLAAAGFREIALTGVNTGCYGHDRGDPNGMADLVGALDALDLGVRFRLNSLEPATVTPALLDALAASRSFAAHFHVPLQHGDSRILRRMGRNYDAAFYRDRIAAIRARFPHAGIGADVMVGFPGETDAAFEACHDFIAGLPLSYLHVFSYSKRDGTAATRLPGHVDPRTKARRSKRLHDLDDRLRRAFIARLSGRDETVLFEGKRGPGGGPCGLTSSYVRVEVDDPRPRENELWGVRITGASSARLATGDVLGPRHARRLDRLNANA